jgi:MFS family permease
VVVGSLATGACAAASLPASVPFLAVAAGGVTAGLRLARTLPRRTDGTPRPAETRPSEARDGTFGPGRPGIVALALIGVLGALAFASENAHQSWSAVFAHDVLHAGNGLAAGAPALFAAVVALARFAVGRVPFRYGRRVLLIGAVGATLGAVGIAAAPNLLLAAVGLTVAAAGTAVLFPTLLSAVARDVDDAYRGRATSAVTFVSYLGFLLGPVYVGAFADLSGLRAAMLAIAALGAALFVLTPVLLRPGAPASRPADRPRSARAGG